MKNIIEELEENAGREDDDEDITLLKSRSERTINKNIMQEIEEYMYNTHIDEYHRLQEIDKWSSKKRELYDSLDRLIDHHVNEIIDFVFKESELQEIFQNDDRKNAMEIWKERFLEYTIKAIRLVKPSQRLMKDTMNINDYVEIELIEHEDDSKCKYINGWVLKNNIADRRMSSSIENPKILLIGNSIGFTQEDAWADLETYVRQENHYIEILMDRINQVKPNVIVVEKEISRTVLSEIRKLDITVVTNVKRKSLEKIARCTETLIIPSTNLIERHFSLGSCKRFYVKLGTTKVINQESKIMTINQSLIYFDGCKPWYGSTICLSGPNDRYLNTIKRYIQKSMKYCRDIVLEKEYLFLSDGDSINKSKSPYLLPKIGIGKSSLKYVKVSIRHVKKEDDDNHSGRDERESDSVDDSEDGKIGENEAQVKKHLNHHWGKPDKKNIEFYSSGDMTLGEFLRKTAAEAGEKCEFCREKKWKHVTDIYHGDGYIEISVSIKNQKAQQIKEEKDLGKIQK